MTDLYAAQTGMREADREKRFPMSGVRQIKTHPPRLIGGLDIGPDLEKKIDCGKLWKRKIKN